ncbi:MAG: hypothetical protein JW994_02045, partial [Candidatus Omnitrophica bacterium]|nr:hypothetical protein [Candidatus Omnitrophota bacterium]
VSSQALFFATTRDVQEHIARERDTRDGRPSLVSKGFLDGLHIDEVQNTIAANDLIKSAGHDLFKRLKVLSPDLAAKIEYRAKVIEGMVSQIALLLAIKHDIWDSDRLRQGGLIKSVKDGHRRSFELNGKLTKKLEDRIRKNPLFEAYFDADGNLNKEAFHNLIREVLSSCLMNDREYYKEKSSYVVTDEDSGSPLPDTIFGNNIRAACIAAKHGWGLEKIEDALIQHSYMSVSSADVFKLFGWNTTHGTGTAEGVKNSIKNMNSERVTVAEETGLVNNMHKVLIGEEATKEEGVKTVRESLEDGTDAIALTSTSRDMCHDMAIRIENEGTGVPIYLLIRGESEASLTCRMPDGRYVNFAEAVGIAKAKFKKGEKMIVIIQGMSTGSNIFELAEGQKRKADIITFGLTNYDNLRQICGRTNDAGKTRAQGGRFVQLVNLYDRDIKDSERADFMTLMSKGDLKGIKEMVLCIQKTMNREMDSSRAIQFMEKSGFSKSRMQEKISLIVKEGKRALSLKDITSGNIPVTIGGIKLIPGVSSDTSDEIQSLLIELTESGAAQLVSRSRNLNGEYSDLIISPDTELTHEGVEFIHSLLLANRKLSTDSDGRQIAELMLDSIGMKSRALSQFQQSEATAAGEKENVGATVEFVKELRSNGLYDAIAPIDIVVDNLISAGMLFNMVRDKVPIGKNELKRILYASDAVATFMADYMDNTAVKDLRKTVSSLAEVNMWEDTITRLEETLSGINPSSERGRTIQRNLNVAKMRYERAMAKLNAKIGSAKDINKISLSQLRLSVAPDITTDDVERMQDVARNIEERNNAILPRISVRDLYNVVRGKDTIENLEKTRPEAPRVPRTGFDHFYNIITGRSSTGKVADIASNLVIFGALCALPPLGIGLAAGKILLRAGTEAYVTASAYENAPAMVASIGLNIAINPGVRKALAVFFIQTFKSLPTAVLQIAVPLVKPSILFIGVASALYASVKGLAGYMTQRTGHAVNIKGFRWLDTFFRPVSQTNESPYVVKAKALIAELGENMTVKDLEQKTENQPHLRRHVLIQLNPTMRPEDTEAMIKNHVESKRYEQAVETIQNELKTLEAKRDALKDEQENIIQNILRSKEAPVKPADKEAHKARAPDAENKRIKAIDKEIEELNGKIEYVESRQKTLTSLPSLIKIIQAKNKLEKIAHQSPQKETQENPLNLRYDVYKEKTASLDGYQHNILLYLLKGDTKILLRADDKIADIMDDGRKCIGTFGNIATTGEILQAVLDRDRGEGVPADITTFARLAKNLEERRNRLNIPLTDEEKKIVDVARLTVDRIPRNRTKGENVEDGSDVYTSDVAAFVNPFIMPSKVSINYDTLEIFLKLVSGKSGISVPAAMNDYLKKEKGLMRRAVAAGRDASTHRENIRNGKRIFRALLTGLADKVKTNFTDPIARHLTSTLEQYKRLTHAIGAIDDKNMIAFINSHAAEWLFDDDGNHVYLDGAGKGLAATLLQNEHVDKDNIIAIIDHRLSAIQIFAGTNQDLLDELEPLLVSMEDKMARMEERLQKLPEELRGMLRQQMLSYLREESPSLSEGQQEKLRDILVSAHIRQGNELYYNRGENVGAEASYRKALAIASSDTKSGIADTILEVIDSQIKNATEWTDKVALALRKFHFIDENRESINPDAESEVKMDLAQLKTEAPDILLKDMYIKAINKVLGKTEEKKSKVKRLYDKVSGEIRVSKEIIRDMLNGTPLEKACVATLGLAGVIVLLKAPIIVQLLVITYLTVKFLTMGRRGKEKAESSKPVVEPSVPKEKESGETPETKPEAPEAKPETPEAPKDTSDIMRVNDALGLVEEALLNGDIKGAMERLQEARVLLGNCQPGIIGTTRELTLRQIQEHIDALEQEIKDMLTVKATVAKPVRVDLSAPKEEKDEPSDTAVRQAVENLTEADMITYSQDEHPELGDGQVRDGYVYTSGAKKGFKARENILITLDPQIDPELADHRLKAERYLAEALSDPSRVSTVRKVLEPVARKLFNVASIDELDEEAVGKLIIVRILMDYIHENINTGKEADSAIKELIVKNYKGKVIRLGDILATGYGVCRHVAPLLYILLKGAGIDSELRRGVTDLGGRHIWLRVNIGGVSVKADPRWNEFRLPRKQDPTKTVADENGVSLQMRQVKAENWSKITAQLEAKPGTPEAKPETPEVPAEKDLSRYFNDLMKEVSGRMDDIETGLGQMSEIDLTKTLNIVLNKFHEIFLFLINEDSSLEEFGAAYVAFAKFMAFARANIKTRLGPVAWEDVIRRVNRIDGYNGCAYMLKRKFGLPENIEAEKVAELAARSTEPRFSAEKDKVEAPEAETEAQKYSPIIPLGEHAKVEKLEDNIESSLRDIFGVDEWSTGSSGRRTYLPNQYGMPADFDYVLHVADFDAEAIDARMFMLRNNAIEHLKSIYGDNIVIVVHRFRRGRAGTYGQAFLTVHRLRAGETASQAQLRYQRAGYRKAAKESLLTIDLTFDTQLNGVERYTQEYNEYIGNILSKLKPEEQEIAREYLTDQIRYLKYLFSDYSTYKGEEGGLRGIGIEVLVLNFDRNVPFDNLEQALSAFDADKALQRIATEGEWLTLRHPSIRKDLIRSYIARGSIPDFASLVKIARTNIGRKKVFTMVRQLMMELAVLHAEFNIAIKEGQTSSAREILNSITNKTSEIIHLYGRKDALRSKTVVAARNIHVRCQKKFAMLYQSANPPLKRELSLPKVLRMISGRESVRGVFSGLLWTHRTGTRAIRDIFATGILKPSRATKRHYRGLNFRYGLDSEYGEVIIVMKNGFEKKYKGVNGRKFNDFFRKAELYYGRKMSEEELKLKIARDYDFRRYLSDIGRDEETLAGMAM